MERRSLESKSSPLKEDIGLFKTGVVDVRLDLSPSRRHSSRGDLICIGFFENTEVEVVFPGRRCEDARPLESELGRIARRARTRSAARMPFQARGVWRARIMESDEVEVKRIYQFLVAEWTLRNDDGLLTTYGAPPGR